MQRTLFTLFLRSWFCNCVGVKASEIYRHRQSKSMHASCTCMCVLMCLWPGVESKRCILGTEELCRDALNKLLTCKYRKTSAHLLCFTLIIDASSGLHVWPVSIYYLHNLHCWKATPPIQGYLNSRKGEDATSKRVRELRGNMRGQKRKVLEPLSQPLF